MKKKLKNWFKNNKKFICMAMLLLVAISVISMFDNSVFGKLTHEEKLLEEEETLFGEVREWFGKLLANAGNAAGSWFLSGFATTLSVIGIVIFFILQSIFSAFGMSDVGTFTFPFPDSIIFNRLSFFDPNFINPTAVGNSVVGYLQGTISSMYYTFFVLALTIFVISAMVIGIKLAVTSVASEKAQYKEALNNWFMGIALLFVLHFLMAGMFALNEAIVEMAYDLTGTIKFHLDILSAIPRYGKFISSIVGGLADMVGFNAEAITDVELPVRGYTGVTLMFLLQAVGGDLVSSLILLIILGQTVALVVTYTKRLFYIIFLGMMAPLIVAVDVVRKAIG